MSSPIPTPHLDHLPAFQSAGPTPPLTPSLSRSSSGHGHSSAFTFGMTSERLKFPTYTAPSPPASAAQSAAEDGDDDDDGPSWKPSTPRYCPASSSATRVGIETDSEEEDAPSPNRAFRRSITTTTRTRTFVRQQTFSSPPSASTPSSPRRVDSSPTFERPAQPHRRANSAVLGEFGGPLTGNGGEVGIGLGMPPRRTTTAQFISGAGIANRVSMPVGMSPSRSAATSGDDSALPRRARSASMAAMEGLGFPPAASTSSPPKSPPTSTRIPRAAASGAGDTSTIPLTPSTSGNVKPPIPAGPPSPPPATDPAELALATAHAQFHSVSRAAVSSFPLIKPFLNFALLLSVSLLASLLLFAGLLASYGLTAWDDLRGGAGVARRRVQDAAGWAAERCREVADGAREVAEVVGEVVKEREMEQERGRRRSRQQREGNSSGGGGAGAAAKKSKSKAARNKAKKSSAAAAVGGAHRRAGFIPTITSSAIGLAKHLIPSVPQPKGAQRPSRSPRPSRASRSSSPYPPSSSDESGSNEPTSSSYSGRSSEAPPPYSPRTASAGGALPPRPPWNVLLPSIFITVIIAACAMIAAALASRRAAAAKKTMGKGKGKARAGPDFPPSPSPPVAVA